MYSARRPDERLAYLLPICERRSQKDAWITLDKLANRNLHIIQKISNKQLLYVQKFQGSRLETGLLFKNQKQ